MLQRKSKPHQLRTYGFLVGVELEDGVCTPEQASFAMQDSLRWKDGVGAVIVDELGEVGNYADEDPIK